MGQARRFLILAASVGAHAVLLAMIGQGGGLSDAEKTEERAAVLSVRLLVPAAAAPVRTAVAAAPLAGPPRPSAAVTADGPSPFPIAIPSPRYYRGSELTRRPRVLDNLPEHFSIDGVPSQNVILRLFINEEGGVDRVEAEQSFLPEAQGRELADAFTRLRFAPGEIGEDPVRSQMRIEVRLEGAIPPAS